MRRKTRIALLTIGLPAFVTGVFVAVIGFQAPGTLMSATSDDAADAPAQPPATLAKTEAAVAPTVPEADPAPPEAPEATTIEVDLLEDLSFVETSIQGQGRYVSLTDPSGLWFIANPSVLARTQWGVWQPQKGLPFGGVSVHLSFHRTQVTNRCVHVEIDARNAFQMQISMAGRTKTVEVPAGISLVKTMCPKEKPPGDSYRLVLRALDPVPEDTDPLVRGAWIVPKGAHPVLGAATRPASCGTAGVVLEPGATLFFRSMAQKDDQMELETSGATSRLVTLTLRDSPGARKILVAPEPGEADPGSLKGSWPLGLIHQRPVEIGASLAAAADEPVCVERLALVRARMQSGFDTSQIPPAKGVVVVLLDTLRYDTAKAFNPGSTVLTPNLDALARRSVVFTNATAHSNYTKPNVGSILTGVYPHANGGLDHSGAMSLDVPMITETMQQAGIQTAGLFSNRFLTDKFNFMRGWDVDEHVDAYKASVDGEIVSEAFSGFSGGIKPDGPFFAWVHLMDPHAPYVPKTTALEIKYVGHRVLEGRFSPRSTSTFITNLRRGKREAPTDDELSDVLGLDRADVASLDVTVGQVVATLEAEGLLDDTLLIVVSDHGEEFMEHGYLGHGTSIHPELTHVPMMVKFPGDAITGEYDGLVGHIDLAPTILDALGLTVPSSLEGDSLIARLDERPDQQDPPAYLLEHWNGTYGIRLGHWMIIGSRFATSLARLDRQKVWYQDPGRQQVPWIYLRQKLALMIRESAHETVGVEEAQIDEETEDQLEALGYILDESDINQI